LACQFTYIYKVISKQGWPLKAATGKDAISG